MYGNKMYPSYPQPAAPTMVSPAMQAPGMGAPSPNMPTMVSPAMQVPGMGAPSPNVGYPPGMPGGFPAGMPGGFPGVGFPGMGGGFPTAVAGAAVAPPPVPSGAALAPDGTVIPTAPPAAEESYIENILRMNLGKVATIYMTFENNREWNAKVFKGVLEAAGRDHVIISDPTTGRRYLLLMVNVDYVTFDEPLTYMLPFGTGAMTGLTRSE